MKAQVDLNDNNITVTVNGITVYSYTEKKIKADFVRIFNDYHGEREYNGVIALAQRWYYGSLVKSAWCATILSYFADQLGILNEIGGKNENVYNMMKSCEESAFKGYGVFYHKNNLPELIKKNDILFYLWEGETMTVNSPKHVAIAEYDSDGDTIFSLGGNQKDKICTLEYNKKNLYAIYRLNRFKN